LSEHLLTLDVEKPAAGGRMLARHEGQVVLVWGAIPGERITARVERPGKGVLYAETVEVLDASPDRVDTGAADWRCGGNVFAHVAYERQRQLKGEILRDALGRIGRMPLASTPDVIGSPPQGYRMRARLHFRGGRLGFYREGTHDLCAVGPTGQLLPKTVAWVEWAQAVLQKGRLDGVLALELAENIPASERATHVELRDGVDPGPYAELATDRTSVTDVLHAREGDASTALRLRRDVRAFFQGNRYLLERLVRHVLGLVPPGPVVDLYAGVGLFGLSLAAAGAEHVTLVEGDPVSGADLADNAEPFGDRVRVERRSVEAFLAGPLRMDPAARGTRPTYIVDPPRTGLSRDAMRDIIRASPARLVYVSCDVATLARDTRALLDAGYALETLTGIDLFPNTAHVESVAVFAR
jgi:tRNA/tmRNA/rRNA uracil-C5-methylase (TrmA/RlmC/RlmD family)